MVAPGKLDNRPGSGIIGSGETRRGAVWMPVSARLGTRLGTRLGDAVADEATGIFAVARPAIVELGGDRPVPWLPGARRWRVRASGAAAAVADLGTAPLVELADRLGPVSDWALVVAPGAEMAGRHLLAAAPGIWSVAIVPLVMLAQAAGDAERHAAADDEAERWRVACWMLGHRGPR